MIARVPLSMQSRSRLADHRLGRAGARAGPSHGLPKATRSRLTRPARDDETPALTEEPGFRPSVKWWGEQDSNLRRQSQWVYSPSPLTTRTSPRAGAAAILERASGGVCPHRQAPTP